MVSQALRQFQDGDVDMDGSLFPVRHTARAAEYRGVIALNLAARITRLNATAEEMLGYSGEALVGSRWDRVFTPEDRAGTALLDDLSNVLDGHCLETEQQLVRADGMQFPANLVAAPAMDDAGNATGFIILLRDLTALRAEAEQLDMLAAEAVHRLKNVFATVQAVAARAMNETDNLPGFAALFGARLRVLADLHDLDLGAAGALGVEDIVRRALGPYSGDHRLIVCGPPLTVDRRVVTIFGLALNELATNAAKHGALSLPAGHVEIVWTVRAQFHDQPVVELVWQERDGPPVRTPAQRGFGSRLLESGLARAFGGTVTLAFPDDGVRCTMVLPLSHLLYGTPA